MSANPIGPAEPFSNIDATEIDTLVPPNIMRLTQHLHNMIYIRFFYEQIGQQPPEWVKTELTRGEAALIAELEREQGQGGAFHKGDRYAARKSRQEQPGELESGAKKQGGFTRRY